MIASDTAPAIRIAINSRMHCLISQFDNSPKLLKSLHQRKATGKMGGIGTMRFWFALAVVITALIGPAFAQRQTPQPTPGPPPKTPQEIEADKAANRAYQKSLRNIPDQPPADPWGIARGTDTPNPTANKTAAKPKSGTKAPAN